MGNRFMRLSASPVIIAAVLASATATVSTWAVDGEILPWHEQAAKAAAAAKERSQSAPPVAAPATAAVADPAAVKPAVVEKIEPSVQPTAGEAPGGEPKPSESLVKESAVQDAPADPKAAGTPKVALPEIETTPAKKLFGGLKSPAPIAARAIGAYSRGCLAGGTQLAIDGSAWQAMRLSRNRNWGHPRLISLLEKFAGEVQKDDAWPGLLIGDISQPRGGPMLTGHASHQLGLDADIWFTPMPKRKLTRTERENLAATSMLSSDSLSVNAKVWGEGQVKIIKRAASYPDVERVLVHPAIKKALCEATGANRSASDKHWLAKVRPYWGHFYHFHVRIGCPSGSQTCKPQGPIPGEDGCGKELDDWFKRLTAPPPPKPTVPVAPVKPKPPIVLADLPPECRDVLAADGGPKSVKSKKPAVAGAAGQKAGEKASQKTSQKTTTAAKAKSPADNPADDP